MGLIATLKEQELLETPLLLFDCELPSGVVERWSTHAVQFAGRDYSPRVQRHNVFEIRAASDDGIDAAAKLSITLANADSHGSQIDRTVGWKGSKLTVWFLFFDLKQGAAVSETVALFRGVANPPEEITEETIRLSFANRLGLRRVLLPEVRIQKRCPWIFPATAEQRAEGIDGAAKRRFSPFYRCGYSPDQAGGTGNLDGGSPYGSCDCTREQCEQRGMFSKDSAGRDTRRFGGIEYLPATIEVRSYGEKGSHLSAAVDNEARYNDFVPLVYGTAWYEPPVVFARNDGNLTRMEVLLGMGEINDVLKVVVNKVEIPEGQPGADMTATGWYHLVSHGSRTGEFNLDFTDSTGGPAGDPYGSMAVLSVVAPNAVSDGRALPRVQVLLEGLRLEQFDANGDLIETSFTNNPAWVLLDLLRRCGWSPEEIDLGSFAAAARHCEELIPASDLYGNPVFIPRYQCNLVVRKRRSAADLVRGVRNGSGLFLTYAAGGRLQVRVEADIATQQPEKPEGSNSVEELDGGWPAYEFGDGALGFSGILRMANGAPSVRLWSKPTADCPNRLSVEFQDQFNEYQQDSLSLVDVDDAIQGGQEVSARLNALGIANFHQAARMIHRQLNKDLRGNTFVQFETSVRAIGLKPGDLVTLTYLKEGFVRQPLRVMKVAAGTNYRTLLIVGQIHDDAWYTDEVSLASGSTVSRRQRPGEVGLPRPLMGTVLDEHGRSQFEISEELVEHADGRGGVNLTVAFTAPAKPGKGGLGIPLVSLSPEIMTGAGTLAGNQTLYYAVSAVNGADEESGLSFLVRAAIPGSTNSNAVRLRELSFAPQATGFHVYRGPNPRQLYRIATNVPLAGDFTDPGASATLAPPPDENYDHARFYWRLERAPEHPATVYSQNTIGSDILRMIDNEQAGMVARISSGKGAGQERTVLGNDTTTLTVTPGWTVTPDSTSMFVIAESGWHFGASGAGSPVTFEVPNRGGATVHVLGRSVNALGRECASELSPLTRWTIGGSAGLLLDADVAGQPAFGLLVTGRGTVEVAGVGFTDLANTRSVEAGTLMLHYWNELAGATPFSLAAVLDEASEVVELNATGSGFSGAMLQIGAEVLTVEEVLDGGGRYVVTRGSHGTAPASHAAGTPVFHLERKVFVMSFARDFFGSPASGSFSYPLFLPDVRIAAADLFVTNSRGSSETARNAFTATTDNGLRTLSGGQFSIQVDGFLAIEDNAAPPLVIEESHSVRDVFATVRDAPTNAPVEMELRQDGELYCELTIPAGARVSNVVDGFGLAPLRERAELTLHIVSVGQTSDTTPGRDLTVTIRL